MISNLVLLVWALVASLAAAGGWSAVYFITGKNLLLIQFGETRDAFFRDTLRQHRSDAFETFGVVRQLALQREGQHEAEIERLRVAHEAVVERLMNLTAFGTIRPADAVVTNAEPDAESRMLRAISEDTVNAGAAVLQREYEQRGVVVSIDELRDEARAMILGVPFTPASERHLGVKD